jgi:hypothetical protein
VTDEYDERKGLLLDDLPDDPELFLFNFSYTKKT